MTVQIERTPVVTSLFTFKNRKNILQEHDNVLQFSSNLLNNNVLLHKLINC